MEKNKTLSWLSLAKKAGKLVSGEAKSENAIRGKQAFLVLVTEDASANTKKKFTDHAAFYHIELRIFGDKASVGRALGETERSSVCILDENMAREIIKTL